MKRLSYSLLATSLLGLASCTKADDPSIAPGPGAPETGYVTGHVVDGQNRPIPDAEVAVNSTGAYAPNLFTRTDADGNYRIKLPSGPQTGQYYVRGHVRFTYENQPYNLMLLTENDHPFTIDESPVRNMHLALAGNRAQNFGDSGYFGGTLEVDNHTSDAHFPNIEVTLEPVGPLVDGSGGVTQLAQPDWMYSYNIPVGKYRVTARDKATGQALTVKNYFHDQGFQSSVLATFEALQAGGDRYGLVIVVAD